MANPGRPTSTGPLVAPGVLAGIIRDAVEKAQAESRDRGTTRIDEAGHLVLLRDAATLEAMAGGAS